jgi:hypothetical protein
MPWFFESGDPDPWLGHLLREEPEGWLVTDRDGVPKYLSRALGKMIDTPTLDASAVQAWRQEFSQPVVNPDTIPRSRRGVVERRRYKNLPPAGGYDATEYTPSLLAFKVRDVTVIGGTKEAGIGFKEADVEVVADGEGTITVKTAGIISRPI